MLMIQDLHWNGYGMGLDTICELWEEIESFRCLKLETVPAGYKMTKIIEATDGMIPVGTGWSLPQLIEALDSGTSFVTTTAINKPFVHILRHYREGEPGRGRRAVHPNAALLGMGAPAHRHLGPLLQALLTPPLPVHDGARPPTDPPVRRISPACRQRNHRVRGRFGLVVVSACGGLTVSGRPCRGPYG